MITGMQMSRSEVDHAKAEPTAPALGRWHPTPFIRAVLALHVVALIALALQPDWWVWILAGFLATHLAIAIAVAFPCSAWLGANIKHLPPAAAARNEVALTFDDGPDPKITPQVLDLLAAADARATFFCIAQNALTHPELVREIVRRGHQVENHSHRHSLRFALYGYQRMAREVDMAQAALAGLTERAPRFFRAPAGMRGPFLDPILQRRNLRYVSWTRRGFDAMERNPKRVLSHLTASLAGGDILLMHDGNSARTVEGKPVVVEVLPAVLNQIRHRGLKPVTLSAAFSAPALRQASPGALTTSARACTPALRSSARTP